MIESLTFMGKEITDAEREKVAKVFDEKIDDLELFKAILTVSMQPEYLVARGAFTKALKNGYCGYAEGGRAAKKLIRLTRRKLGYKYTAGDRLGGAAKAVRNVDGKGAGLSIIASIRSIVTWIRGEED
ncbi:MAG: hypothetical protein PW788_14335 [Micavibrio sp.]|nr:hypothetical protein [Micavibrio sp.]